MCGESVKSNVGNSATIWNDSSISESLFKSYLLRIKHPHPNKNTNKKVLMDLMFSLLFKSIDQYEKIYNKAFLPSETANLKRHHHCNLIVM
jgi:hypothetical protein